MTIKINLNADMAEGFGAYDIGDDAGHRRANHALALGFDLRQAFLELARLARELVGLVARAHLHLRLFRSRIRTGRAAVACLNTSLTVPSLASLAAITPTHQTSGSSG